MSIQTGTTAPTNDEPLSQISQGYKSTEQMVDQSAAEWQTPKKVRVDSFISSPSSELHTHLFHSRSVRLLTTTVEVLNPITWEVKEAVVFFDCGSERTFIKKSFAGIGVRLI